MKTYAIIISGVVENIVVGDDVFPSTCENLALDISDKPYVSRGWEYTEENGFRSAQNYPSWTWNDEKRHWVSPKPRPEGDFDWSEDVGDWVPSEPKDLPL